MQRNISTHVEYGPRQNLRTGHSCSDVYILSLTFFLSVLLYVVDTHFYFALKGTASNLVLVQQQ